MSIKQIVHLQYQSIVDRASKDARDLPIAKEGWLRTVRKALNISGVQLAKRLGVTKASVFKSEKAELSGGITIKKMEQIAEGMGCRFVYFVVPEQERPIKEVLSDRARKKAIAMVRKASNQMALEDQTLSNEQLEFEVSRLQKQLLSEMPADLWDDR